VTGVFLNYFFNNPHFQTFALFCGESEQSMSYEANDVSFSLPNKLEMFQESNVFPLR